MKKSVFIGLLAFLSISLLSVGCADSKPNKRVRVGNTSLLPKTQPEAETPKVDGEETPEQDGQESGVPAFDEAKAQELMNQFVSNKISGEEIDFSSLKDLKVDLSEVNVMFRLIAKNEKESNFLALSSYKVERDEKNEVTGLTQTGSTSLGSSTNTSLLSLPASFHIEFDQNGNINTETHKISNLNISVNNQALSLTSGQSTEGAVLETLPEIFLLEEDAASGLKSSEAGVDVFTEVMKSDDQVGVLIEAVINDYMIQTFHLKFKVQKTEVDQESTTP